MTIARLLFCLVAVMPLPAAAQDLASSDTIRATIVGNTVSGSMIASGGFTEYYAPDGVIRGPDYTGQWSINGSQMCFGYDGNPASCWGVRVSGNTVAWIGAAGEEGTGTILPGNPNGY